MIEISNDRSKLQLNVIHQYLSTESYWAQGRSLSIIQRSIDNSLCFGVYKDGAQIGFARVVTDYAVFAWIMDVFIVKEHQGNGYGKQLMQAITTHPELQTLKRWGLGTDDAHGLYKQFGFTALSKPNNIMERKEVVATIEK